MAAAIHGMRRIMQSRGTEVMHLGHNRSVREVVEAAIQDNLLRLMEGKTVRKVIHVPDKLLNIVVGG